MMRSNASKDSSRGFQVSSKISFLISVRKILLTSGQTVDLTSKIFFGLGTKRGESRSEGCADARRRVNDQQEGPLRPINLPCDEWLGAFSAQPVFVGSTALQTPSGRQKPP